MRPPRALPAVVLVAVLLAVALLTPPPTGPVEPAEAAKNCSGCHKRYNPLSIQASAPATLGINLTDRLQMTLGVPWKHEARDVRVQVAVSGAAELAPGEPAERTVAAISTGSTATLAWNLTGAAAGNATVDLTIDSTSYYRHKKSNKPNSQAEHFTGQLNVEVRTFALGLTPSLLLAPADEPLNATLWLVSGLAGDNLTGLRLAGEGELAPYVNFTGLPEVLEPGATAVVNLTLAAGHPGGRLRLDYLLPDGTPGNATVQVLTAAPAMQVGVAVDRSGYFLTIGGLYGWLVVGLMVVAMAQGFTKRWFDRRFSSAFRETRKAGEEWDRETPGERASYWWWLHTLLLFILIAFAYVHLLGVFRSGYPVEYDLPTVLGVVALLVLTAVGLSGLHPPFFKKRLGSKGWKRLHAVLSAAALLLGLVHGVLLRNVF